MSYGVATDLDLLLFTINAGYVHPAMGLWYLRSNLGPSFRAYSPERSTVSLVNSSTARSAVNSAVSSAATSAGSSAASSVTSLAISSAATSTARSATLSTSRGNNYHTVDLLECTRRDGHDNIVKKVISRRPRVLAVSLSIWNHTDTFPVLRAVRRHLPDTIVVIGGPEASHLPLNHPTLQLVDGVVRGEGDLVFGRIIEELLDGGGAPPSGFAHLGGFTLPSGIASALEGARHEPDGRYELDGRRPWVYDAPLPDLSRIELPHRLFREHDIQRRFMYLEASRGCPFRCQFCLSSLSSSVRLAPLETLFDTIDYLLKRGADRFKFIDRTFNLDYERAAAVLEFWLSRIKRGISVQFETVPDRFPPELRDLIRRFPEESLRLEVGIQTFNRSVAKAIDRYSDQEKTIETLTFLTDETGATVHADLIVGLPGESITSFGRGFDRLYRYKPGEIQVGILKRLHGAPIAAHDATIRYSSEPPYDVIETDWITKEDIDRLKRFAKYWELVVNRGRFPGKIRPLLGLPNDLDGSGDINGRDDSPKARSASPFERFLAFTDFAWDRFGRTWALTPEELGEAIDDFVDDPIEYYVAGTNSQLK